MTVFRLPLPQRVSWAKLYHRFGSDGRLKNEPDETSSVTSSVLSAARICISELETSITGSVTIVPCGNARGTV